MFNNSKYLGSRMHSKSA